MPQTADQPHLPPAAPRIAWVRELHGRSETDDYAWMRDRERPALRAYLAAERAFYDAHAALLSDLTGRLTAESAGRIPDRADDSVGWPLSGFIYRTRTPQGRENLQFLRSRSGENSEQVLLDENIIGAVTGYVEVGAREPSPDANLVAWSADSSVLFYLVPDDLNRPFQVWRHRIGRPAAADVLVLSEPDGRYELTLHASRSGHFAVITSACRDTTEVRLIPLADPFADPILVEPRRRGVEYRLDHARADDGAAGWLYVVTDDTETEFTLKRAPAGQPGAANWTPVDCGAVAPARGDTRLLSCDVIGRASCRKECRSRWSPYH